MKNKEFRNFRCNTCNCVSHAEIASELGNFNEKPFYPDPLGLGYVCHDCRDAVQDALEDWDYEDEQELEDEDYE
jgi:hypothetical protein